MESNDNKLLEEICSRPDFVLSNFCSDGMSGRLLEVCSCFDLQFDLSPYGYEEHCISRVAYEIEEEYQEAERLRKLEKAKAKLAMLRSGKLTFRSMNGKFEAEARKTDSEDVMLKIFRTEKKLHLASVLIGQAPVLEDGSYGMRTVIMRYDGQLVDRPGFFLQAVETMSGYGSVEKLNFTVFDGPEDPEEYLDNFSNVIDLDEVSSLEIFPDKLSFDKKDLVRGMSLGFHPERVAAIVSDERPIGSARKKRRS